MSEPVALARVRTIAVGSTSPAKLDAIRRAVEGLLADLFPAAPSVRGVPAASGVRPQPIGDVETRAGAEARARGALAAVAGAELALGLEGGVTFDDDGTAWAFSWVAATDRSGQQGAARSAAFELPQAWAAKVRHGAELGDAIDETFGGSRLKDGPGAVGLLTAGKIVRAELYRDAVVLALVPWLRAAAVRPPDRMAPPV